MICFVVFCGLIQVNWHYNNTGWHKKAEDMSWVFSAPPILPADRHCACYKILFCILFLYSI